MLTSMDRVEPGILSASLMTGAETTVRAPIFTVTSFSLVNVLSTVSISPGTMSVAAFIV